MKNASYRRAAVLALGLAAVMSNAAAQIASSSANISNFTYQLFDLDLTDGITPSLSFVESLESRSSYITGPGAGLYDSRMDHGATSAAGAYGNASTLTSVAGQQASVAAEKPASGYISSRASNLSLLEFTLSPSTGVRFTLSAQAASTHSPGDFALARVTFIGTLDHPRADSSYRYTRFVDELYADDNSLAARLFGYLETDTAARTGELRIDSVADASVSGIPAVPEPQTYLMLLAGAAVLVGARKRVSR